MRKNCMYTPVTATTRNEVIDFITDKKEVIYIEGDAYQTIINELKSYSKDYKSNRFTGCSFKIGSGLTILNVVSTFASLTIPGRIFRVAASTILFIFGHVFSMKPELLKGYQLGSDIYDNKMRFVLVSNKYSFELDSIDDGCVLTDNNKCTKCGNVYNENTKHCPVCNTHVISVSTKNALNIIKSI